MGKFNRSDYMNEKCTHDEYYSQFVSEGLLNAVVARIGATRIINSNDKYLNDIELSSWDMLRDLVISYCGNAIAESNGSGGVSLSDTVCVAKAAAAMYIERMSK